MRLFWWRGKKDKAGDARAERANAGTQAALQVAERAAPAVREGLLLFARDYLLARGARVRVEREDLITGTLPDGTQVSYTTSPARAGEYEDARLLAPGSAELADLLDHVAREARVVALSLPARASAADVAREVVTEPPRDCRRCRAAPVGNVAPCEVCPLLDGRYTLAGLGAVRRARELREREAWSAEVVFRVVARDKAGRLDETVRVALSLDTCTAAPPLSADVIEGALGEPVPVWAGERLGHILDVARARLRPAVSATAGFLEARSRNEFLRRRDEVASMAAALRREPAADRAAIERSLAAELRRLEDVFAVEVEATVASVAFVRSRLVEVALERPGGRELLVTVDVGRRQVLPPACGACGGPCHSGAVCGEGHVVCASCSATAPRDARCPVCAHGRGAGAPHEHAMAGGLPSGEQLRAASLASMPDAVWSACAAWLLEQRGIAVQRVTAGQAGLTIYGAQGERAVFASAVRSDVGWRLGEHDVRRAAALTAGQPGALGILLSPSIADDGARAEADRLGVELWDGVALDALLARAGSRYEDERAAAADERARRLALAGSVRAELVAAMEAAEAALSTGDSGPALSGQRRVAAEVRAVNEARGVVLQAFAAWETAVADYVSAFGGRAERDGSLGVIATEDTLASLRERIRHLAAVTGPAAGTVGASAGRGELGYSAWRKAVVEELVARCEAVRWRALSVDPAEASDFAAARDEQAALKAEEATVAAERAAMRVEAAYVQLVERARL